MMNKKIDGEEIASDIKNTLRHEGTLRGVSLAVALVGDNVASEQYVGKKQDFGSAVGARVTVHKFLVDSSEEEVVKVVEKLKKDPHVTAILIQLPLPRHFDTTALLNLIPPEKDVDALGSAPIVQSPVVEAIAEILQRNGVVLDGKKVVVLGAKGRLVGKPIMRWLSGTSAKVISLDMETQDIAAQTRDADIIISGTGRQHLVKPDMIRTGVVLIDAGISTVIDAGGDIHPDCFKKAAIYTPVPGGLGPVTVAMLFRNLAILAQKKQ